MDLHAWITQQVDRAEMVGRRITLVPNDGSRVVTGTVADVSHGAEGLGVSVAQHPDETVDPANLRRCEADRRILARHNVDPARADDWQAATNCDGCGFSGHLDLPNVDNLNDCPELLDLAHAHGLTDEIFAGLDRPTPPERKPTTGSRLGHQLTTLITTSDVPAALRGTNWKP